MPARSNLRLGVLAALALVLAACAQSSSSPAVEVPEEEEASTSTTEFVTTGENLAPDPRSTRDLLGGGGGILVPLRFADIPHISDLAVIVDVVDIRPSRLNTPDGKFPPIDPNRGPEQAFGLLPETPVVVKVVEVLAERPAVPSGGRRGRSASLSSTADTSEPFWARRRPLPWGSSSPRVRRGRAWLPKKVHPPNPSTTTSDSPQASPSPKASDS